MNLELGPNGHFFGLNRTRLFYRAFIVMWRCVLCVWKIFGNERFKARKNTRLIILEVAKSITRNDTSQVDLEHRRLQQIGLSPKKEMEDLCNAFISSESEAMIR